MANLNQIVCTNKVANTGFGNCFLDPANIIGGFIVPNGFLLDAASLADLQVSIELATKEAIKLNRAFPIGNFVAMTDNSEDKTVQTFAYGGKKVVKEGDYDWSFQFTEGGVCLQKALRSFNSNGSWSVIFYDANFVLYGTTGPDANALYGIPLKVLWTSPWKPNDGSNSTVYTIQTVFEPRFINEELAYVQAGSYLDDLKGYQDIILKARTWVEATGALNITAYSRCGTNLYDLYPTELGAVAAFKANNAFTGNAITITSVTANPATKSFDVVIATGDSDFPAAAQGILFDTVDAAALDIINVVGYESAGPITLATT